MRVPGWRRAGATIPIVCLCACGASTALGGLGDGARDGGSIEAAGPGDLGLIGDAGMISVGLPAFFSCVDTMKESRDRETYTMTDAQIADDVNLSARLNTSYITVSTNWDYPAFMSRWVAAIRATGRRVWFRGHPDAWEARTCPAAAMTPAQYIAWMRSFIAANPGLFAPGDIFDACSEPENAPYWPDTYCGACGAKCSWASAASPEYNQFLRDSSDAADAAFHAIGVQGVITSVRSTNSWWPTHGIDATTIAKFGHVTIDSYPEGTSLDPATCASARVGELQAIHAALGVPIIIGEMGYSNDVDVTDAQQDAVLQAEASAIEALPFVAGINYWVGAGTSTSGGYTHLFAGSTGGWTLRPGGADVAGLFGDVAKARNVDVARFGFEAGATGGWTGTGTVSRVASSGLQAYRGGGSLGVDVSGAGVDTVSTTTALAGLGAATPLVAHVWTGSGAIGGVTLFVRDAVGATYRSAPVSPPVGSWTTLTFTVPATATSPLGAAGVAFIATGAATLYVDTVDDGTYAR